ncbi:MAG: hypothetical protein QM813_17095 [Verrucomicrobiota bacterium]
MSGYNTEDYEHEIATLKAALAARDAELAEAQQTVRNVVADLGAANAKLTASEKDAARWRHARQFLSIEDIEGWQEEGWFGHQPNEDESMRADEAIDNAMKEFGNE